MKKYEYLILHLTIDRHFNEGYLDRLGSTGWCLVQLVPDDAEFMAIFSRELLEDQNAT